MTESEVVKEWVSKGETKGELKQSRQKLVELLEGRFPGMVSSELTKLIADQESMGLLDDWFKAAVRAYTFEQFMAVLRK